MTTASSSPAIPDSELALLDAYWRAANYLSVGQIYLKNGLEPDVVMACAGDVPTLETLAAVDLLRQHFPDLNIRVVNVVNRVPRLQKIGGHFQQFLRDKLVEHGEYIRRHGDEMPEVRDWKWPS